MSGNFRFLNTESDMSKSAKAVWKSLHRPSRALERLLSRKSPVSAEGCVVKEEDVRELELPKRPIWETEPADSIESRSEAPAEDSKVAAS